MKRNNKFIRKYNFHISNQKKMKRYITYLKNNIDNFSVVIKTENNIKANEIWYDVYEVGNWDLTISRIKKAFKNEFKSKFLQNPLIVEKKKIIENGVNYLMIAFQMNYKYQIESDVEDGNEFDFIYCCIKNYLYFYLGIIKIKNLNNGLYLVENYAKTSVISQNFEENITYELESDKVFNYKNLLEFLFENNFQEFTEETLLIFLRRIYKKFKEKNKELKEIELIPYEVKDLSDLLEDYQSEKHKYIEEKIESLNNKKENIKIFNKIKEDEIDEEIEKLEKCKKVLSYYNLDDYDEYKKSYK